VDITEEYHTFDEFLSNPRIWSTFSVSLGRSLQARSGRNEWRSDDENTCKTKNAGTTISLTREELRKPEEHRFPLSVCFHTEVTPIWSSELLAEKSKEGKVRFLRVLNYHHQMLMVRARSMHSHLKSQDRHW